jgi:hypothetical protein
MLTKESIFGANDITIEKVEIPEWGGNVFVKTMTGRERDAYEESCIPEDDGEKTDSKQRETNFTNIRARMACMTICDENGKRLFTMDDAQELGEKSASGLDRIFTVATELNKISAADVEELAKN